MMLSGIPEHGPVVDLLRFKAGLRSGDFHVYGARALEPIRCAMRCSMHDARKVARQMVLSLRACDYGCTLRLPNGEARDIYGVLIGSDDCFLRIELHMDGGRPAIVACEPAENEAVMFVGVSPYFINGG
jgi:hypothetical protein